jgi:hypothetical protein
MEVRVSMAEQIIIEVIGGLFVVLLLWCATIRYARWRMRTDSNKVYDWLRENTRDSPRESHKKTSELAKATRLSEERVCAVCVADERIHRSSKQPDQWSVWREEPESIYNKRGLIII